MPPDELYEEANPADKYKLDKARIANYINVLRNQNFQDIADSDSSVDFNGELIYPDQQMLDIYAFMEQEIIHVMGQEPRGKGHVVLAEFTPDDAEVLIRETTNRWLNNSLEGGDKRRTLSTGEQSLDTGNGQALKYEFAAKLLDDFDFHDGRIDYKIKDITPVSDEAYTYLHIDDTTDQFKKSQDSKQAIIDQVTLQMWNDSSAVHNIDILEMSAVAARDQGYLGEGEDFPQAMYELITRTNTDFPQELLGDGLTINQVNQWASNWANTVLTNEHEIREYLVSGKVKDETGNTLSKVASYSTNDAQKSIIALLGHEKFGDKVLDGTALVPQVGNTLTEQRENRMQELMGSWGWDHSKSTGNNIDRILSTQGRDPGDKVTFPDGDERYALRQERDEMTARIDSELLSSGLPEDTDAYNNFLFGLVDEEFGNEYSGYDSRVSEKLAGLNAQEWDLSKRTGMDNAAETVLDHYGLLKAQISEESFESLSSALNKMNYGSLGEAMDDPTLWATINAAKDQKEIEDAAEDRGDMNKSTVLQAGILSAARSTGIIGPTTSSEFQIHFEKNVLPEIERRIANAGGINNISDIERYVANAVRPGDVFKTYDLDEESYTQHFDPGSPPPIPSMYMPGLPGFGDPNTAGTMKYTPEVFDIASLTPELQWLAYERPEFAKFLADEMQTQEYKDAFQKEAAPQFDKEEYSKQISGLWEQQVPKYEAYQESLKKAATAKEAQEVYATQMAGTEIVGEEGEGAMPDEPIVPTSPESKAYIDQVVAEREAAAEAAKIDPFVLDPSFRADQRARLTTPGKTTREFFESRLPGFEERFKRTPFFQQQEERIKREGEREEQQALSEEREERRVESERRRRLRAGTSGRGLTVFRRRQ